MFFFVFPLKLSFQIYFFFSDEISRITFEILAETR